MPAQERSRFHASVAVLLAALALVPTGQVAAVSPAEILAEAPANHWAALQPSRLVVMDLSGGRRVVIETADAFAPRHAADLRQRVRSGWFDGQPVTRVQDNYVTQWGEAAGPRALPEGVQRSLAPEFEVPGIPPGFAWTPLPDGDIYASHAGFIGAWPVGRTAAGTTWLAHCYGMVGAGREDTADSGSTGELYVVIGHAPRHLDRNITLLGRVVSGMEHLAALPRGTDTMGVYAPGVARPTLERMVNAIDLPEDQRPRLQVLRTDTDSYTRWLEARRQRDGWFIRPAGRIDLCNAQPPLRSP